MFREKCVFFILCFLLISSAVWAQAPPHIWSHYSGDASDQKMYSVAVDASDNVIVAGIFLGLVDFGGGMLISAGSWDIFMAKFDPNGNHMWSQRFGDAAEDRVNYITVDVWGNIIMTGRFDGTIDFGGGVLTSAGSKDSYVAKFDAGGSHIWSQRYGDSGDQRASCVDTDGYGNIVVTGLFDSTVDFGGGPLTSAGGYDIFLVKFDPNGGHLWSQGFGDSYTQYGMSVAVDALDNVIFTGYFSGTVDFGGGPITRVRDMDLFLAKFEPDGTHIWSKGIGARGFQIPRSVTTDNIGNVIITGGFEGSVDFGGGTITCAGSDDTFIAAYDPDGNHRWSHGFGDSRPQNATCVVADNLGNVVFCSLSEGTTIDFGGGPFLGPGFFTAKFDYNGNHVWSEHYGNTRFQYANGVALDSDNNVMLVGSFWGLLDLGGGPVLSSGGEDVFVAKFGFQSVATQLKNYSAKHNGSGIEIQWNLSEEGRDMEFFVLRAEAKIMEFRELRNPAVKRDGMSFCFVDNTCESGFEYRYRVDVCDENGRRMLLFETETLESANYLFALNQSYPNPFNPQTTIPYTIPTAGFVKLWICSSDGKIVNTLVNESKQAGEHEVTWNGLDNRGMSVASGIYFVRLQYGGQVQAKKVIFIK